MRENEERSGKMENMKMCFECGAKEQYEFKDTIRKYEGEGYHFEMSVKVPFCKICQAPIYMEAVENEIAKMANQRIREQREIITREEILEILELYNVSQKFLSRLLGWGEITLTRYVSGNYTPNVSNSNRLKELKNPYIFQMLLQDYCAGNPERAGEKSFKKAESKVSSELAKLENSKGKIFHVVNWFLAQSTDEVPITHLALQKLLYFVQNWSRVLLGQEMFEEDCQAWVHGAVYPQVYSTFKSFKYMPLPKVEVESKFKEEELKILNAVKLYYLDVYCAKALEEICHREEPYKKAREGCRKNDVCQRVINKNDVLSYYTHIVQKYRISLENLLNIREYLNIILR